MIGPDRIGELCVGPECSLREAIERIDRGRSGVILVVDADGRMTDLITDGDVRRLVLADRDLRTPVGELHDRSRATPHGATVAGRAGQDEAALLATLRRHRIRHLPILDDAERVVGLVTLEDLLEQPALPVQAVIMAGGKGTRLRPLTDSTPKPMLQVGDRPLLEHIVDGLRRSGISRIHISTHYKPEQITDHFRDGSRFGVNVHYVSESQPLGTAGALSLLERPRDPLLVMNGDILTAVDFRAMLAYHQEHGAELTLAARRQPFRLPYGVVGCAGPFVKSLEEKPDLRPLVNAGIYLIQPSALELVPAGRAFDMPDLVRELLAGRRRVVAFPVHEYWRDIGCPPDYTQAQADVRGGRLPR